MAKVTEQEIHAALHTLNLALSSRNTPEEIRVKAKIFYEDCGHIQSDDFRECVKRYRRNFKYFPTPSDILNEYKMILNTKKNTTKELPMPTELSDEQIEVNLKNIKKLKKILANKFNMNGVRK